MSVRFKRLGTEAAIEVRQIWHEAVEASEFPAGGKVWGLDDVRAALELGLSKGAIGESGELFGFVLAMASGENIEIVQIATRPDQQRRHLMRDLLGRVISECERDVWLEVHALNRAAVRLYESLGFKMVGRRASYYADGSDALLFTYFRNS